MPSEQPALPRRTLLAVSGTAVLAAAAACSSGGTAAGTSTATSAGAVSGSSAARTSSSPPAGASSDAGAVTPTSSAAATATSGASAAAPTGPALASVAEVESAGSVVVEAADGPLLLAYSDGTVVAHTAVCTHQQCTIVASGMCPCHGSKFSVTTGAVENGPALRPLAGANVTVSDGQLYLA